MNQIEIINNLESAIKDFEKSIKQLEELRPKVKIGYAQGKLDGMLEVFNHFKKNMEEELTKWK